MMLCPSSIAIQNKRQVFETVWSWTGKPSVQESPWLTDSVLAGAGSAGPGFNINRWREFLFLIRVARGFKQQSESERNKLLGDGWRFADFLASVEDSEARQLRHMLLFMLWPDLFERIFGGSDRQIIVAAFSRKTLKDVSRLSALEIDHELAQIRSDQEAKFHTKELDFYAAPLREQWERVKLPSASEQSVWIFQANPQKYDIDGALKRLATIVWSVRQYGNLIKKGDLAYIWRSGKQAGICAVATIDDNPSPLSRPEAERQFVKQLQDEGPAVPCTILKVLPQVLPKQTLQEHPILKDLSVLKFFQNTNYKVSSDQAAALAQFVPLELREPAPLTLALDDDWLGRQTLLSDDQLKAILDALRGESPQIIFSGPPGTSKTWIAECIAQYLTQGREGAYRIVQFHPSFSYESFIEGLRPVGKDGKIEFQPTKGALLDFIDVMEQRKDLGPGRPLYVLVIDEMNRANLSRVFGELMYLFEYRDKKISLQYRKDFALPSNLRFIGTMNTADRSIRSIDIALRRRFDVFEFPPSSLVLDSFFEGKTCEVANLSKGLTDLNNTLESELDRHHKIGHAFFMKKALDRKMFEAIWHRKIHPLIEEYFFDQPDKAKEFTIERFWPA